MNSNKPKKLQIVITYLDDQELKRWIGGWKEFKQAHPRKPVKHVETLYEYTERVKPLNNKR